MRTAAIRDVDEAVDDLNIQSRDVADFAREIGLNGPGRGARWGDAGAAVRAQTQRSLGGSARARLIADDGHGRVGDRLLARWKDHRGDCGRC